MKSAATRSEKQNKKPPKNPTKKRKLSDLKSQVRDSIAETISFVIKGELTPIKPTPILNKIVKNKVCKPNVRKVRRETEKPAKDPKKTKKVAVKPQKVKKQNAKVSSRNVGQKKVEKSSSETLKKSRQTKTKIPKSSATPPKPPVKKTIRKTNKTPKESSECKKESPDDEIKKQETIEKLLKEAKSKVLKTKPVVKRTKPKATKNKDNSTPKKDILPTNTPDEEVKVKKEKIEEELKKLEPKPPPKEPEIIPEIPQPEPVKKSPEPTEQIKVKVEPEEEPKKQPEKSVKFVQKSKVSKCRKEQKRNAKLFNFWNGPKRHRVASLNALAKVHCLYENEGKGNIIDKLEDRTLLKLKKENVYKSSEDEKSDSPPPTRTLRSVPGLRAIGKHWDMHDTTTSSSSSEEESDSSVEYEKVTKVKKEPSPKKIVSKEIKGQTEETEPKPQKQHEQKKRRRRRTELIMDLKDMVVRKRMASLNASAILAASYSVEKRSIKSNKSGESSYDSDSSDAYYALSSDKEDDSTKKPKIEEGTKQEDDNKLIEVHASPNKKVAVILNQDTDVTITGVYVNSTTRSTHHEGYCSIAGMRYRISATSHTQTAATAVATETLLPAENAGGDGAPQPAAGKSYTPLAALSSMQPPAGPGLLTPPPPAGRGQQAQGGAFSSPPPYGGGQKAGEQGYAHGYYQPAGPLITVPHGHAAPPPAAPKVVADSPTAPPPPASADSSDSEVIITSVTAGTKPSEPPPPPSYRYQYAAQYPYPYAAYHYATPPPPPPPPPNPPYHELCYAKYAPAPPPVPYGRYLGAYYQEAYPGAAAGGQAAQQVVSAAPASSSATAAGYATGALLEPYAAPAAPAAPPAPPPGALVDAYQAAPAHYYPPAPAPAYALPPSCYTHPGAGRPPAIPYIDAAAYQACPCPMRSCPKNGPAGPLTGGGGKRPEAAAAPPPVALAAPPTGAAGPPSPARGSAGAPPPPPSPAVAAAAAAPASAYHPPPREGGGAAGAGAGQGAPGGADTKRRARVGKAMVRNHMQNTMLLMCNTNQNHIKREIESPKEKEEQKKECPSSDEETKTIIEKNEPTTPDGTTTLLKNESPEEKTIVLPVVIEEEKTSINNNNNNIVEAIEIRVEEENNNISEKIDDEPLPPCTVTVAENVKVKNMKRKQSLSKEDDTIPSPPPKKQKLGSYKNLIKKLDTNRRIVNKPRQKPQTKVKRKPPPPTRKTKPLLPSNRNTNIDRTIESVVVECRKKKSATSRKAEAQKKRRRSTKVETVPEVVPKAPRRSLPTPKWSNGWRWEGEPYEGRVFLNSDETAALRKCYPAMRHEEGDILLPRDCVLLKAGPRRNDLPYVAKIAYLWENPEDGEMMMSLLWYYRPEHTEQGRLPSDQTDEVFASRHKDSNSVACIDDKCYVLTFNEYCRYKKRFKQLDEGVEGALPCIPLSEPYGREQRQPPSSNISPEMIFFCRKVYDFRQKRIVKNPT